jgi:hypothetical protein
MAMSTAQRPRGARSEQADDLTWLVAPDAPLPDGRAVDAALLSAMIAEWRAIIGGAVYVSRLQRRWASISDEPWTMGSQRLEGEANDVTAVLNHANGRAVTAGLSAPHSEGNVPGSSYLSATALLADAVAVLLAVLDRHLVGAGDLTAWYLATPCDPRNCLYHGDGRGPERRGSGVEPVDYGALPPLYWHPGYGTVETHPAVWHELVARDTAVRRPIRLPTPATAPPGVFQHPRRE